MICIRFTLNSPIANSLVEECFVGVFLDRMKNFAQEFLLLLACHFTPNVFNENKHESAPWHRLAKMQSSL